MDDCASYVQETGLNWQIVLPDVAENTSNAIPFEELLRLPENNTVRITSKTLISWLCINTSLRTAHLDTVENTAGAQACQQIERKVNEVVSAFAFVAARDLVGWHSLSTCIHGEISALFDNRSRHRPQTHALSGLAPLSVNNRTCESFVT
jgi:hypothetical protein